MIVLPKKGSAISNGQEAITFCLVLFLLIGCQPSYGTEYVANFPALSGSPSSGYFLRLYEDEIVEIDEPNGLLRRVKMTLDLQPFITATKGRDPDWWASSHFGKKRLELTLGTEEYASENFYGLFNYYARKFKTKESQISGLRKTTTELCGVSENGEKACWNRREYYATSPEASTEHAVSMSCPPMEANPRSICSIRVVYRGRVADLKIRSVEVERYKELIQLTREFLNSRVEEGGQQIRK